VLETAIGSSRDSAGRLACKHEHNHVHTYRCGNCIEPVGSTRMVRALGPFLGLAVVIVFFAAIGGNPARYLSANNLRIVLTQTVIVALGAIGMTVIIISGGIDLSVGSVIALSGVSAAIALKAGWPPFAALLWLWSWRYGWLCQRAGHHPS